MAKKITDEQKEQINELYFENKNKSLTARLLGISPASVARYIVDGYVPKEKRNIETFNGRPSVISFDKIASFDGAADIGYFFTHMTEDEKEDIKKLQKEIFI